MKIIEYDASPIFEFRFLNAGRSAGGFYQDRLPVYRGRVDSLPHNIAAVVVTADLQGRECFEDASGNPLRLLGEVLPQRLVQEVLPELSLAGSRNIGAILAGDFYTVPALDKRGGTGDVTAVWKAFAESFAWVAGVPGNHDLFGNTPKQRPRFSAPIHYLDGDIVEIEGLKIAGLGGIVGNPDRHNRRTEDDYLSIVGRILDLQPHVLLMHDGPDGPEPGQRGNSRVRELLECAEIGLVIRGHAHWEQALVEFPSGLQVLNVDARVVVLTT
jgi:Icc-related predicted phosphoesterase